jgi:crotonobetainyl-CoA:carnitine CoA-transferase CaiB-like acyl-CoA transferase
VPPPRQAAQGPLTGLRILDFTRLLPGPLATMQLAELGAEVWKVEHPDRPDYVREALPQQAGVAAYYRALNRSKRSLSIAYDQPEGLEALRARIREADLGIEQFRPGVMDALGLGVEDVWAINPRCSYVSLTGFGQQGPRRDQAGHDLNYLALSGILSLNRDARGRPVIPGFQLADIAGGSYLAVSACTLALLAAQRTGQGEYVDVGMAGGLLPLLTLPWADYQATGELPANGHTPLSGAWVNYQVYETADGRWVALGALEPKFWERFCEAVERPGWKAWLGETPAAHPEVAALFASRSRDEWAALGARVDCCLSPVLALDELPTEPQWAGAWAGEGPDRGLAQPLRLRQQPGGMQGPAPALGADGR